MVREGLGILVRTAGVLLLTRLIGPEQYGLFAGSLFVVLFGTALATTGLDLFLNRRSGQVEDDWYHQVFSCLLVSSVVVTAAGVALAGVVGDVVDDQRIVGPLQVLLLSIPLNIMWVPARSRLERAFRFRPLVISEVGADVVQYVLAIGLALAGLGVWAAVYGFLARQAFMLEDFAEDAGGEGAHGVRIAFGKDERGGDRAASRKIKTRRPALPQAGGQRDLAACCLVAAGWACRPKRPVGRAHP